jgi:transcriptional regulator with XRE-family HTH domain
MRGDRLQELREKKDLSRDKLAKVLGIGSASIERYENGKQSPSADVLVSIARHFDVSSDYLLGLTDDPRSVLKDDNFNAVELRSISLLHAASPEDQTRILRVIEVMTDHGSAGV